MRIGPEVETPAKFGTSVQYSVPALDKRLYRIAYSRVLDPQMQVQVFFCEPPAQCFLEPRVSVTPQQSSFIQACSKDMCFQRLGSCDQRHV